MIKLSLCIWICFSFVVAQEKTAPQPISKEIYLSYTEYPKRVFTGQKFKVHIQALIVKSRSQYDDMITTVSQTQELELLTQNIKWKENEDGTISTVLQYKASDKEFKLPTVTLALLNNGQVVSHSTLQPVDIKYEKIAINQKRFSNIIASNLKIISVKTKQYSNTQLHSTINIEGFNSNLEDIYLSNYDEQGTSSLTQNEQKQNLYYYVVTPLHVKQIDFTYYSTVENEFVRIQLPIILEEELVSTQTELNPYHNSMLLYKQVAAGVLLALFLLLYLFQRKITYLVFVTIFIVLLTYLFIPNEKILLQSGIKVYILPTTNSTVYKTLETKQIVEKVVEKNEFVKVIFSNENVGWVSKNDIN